MHEFAGSKQLKSNVDGLCLGTLGAAADEVGLVSCKKTGDAYGTLGAQWDAISDDSWRNGYVCIVRSMH